MSRVTDLPLDPAPELPQGWSARVPGPDDVERITEIGTAHRRLVRGTGFFVEEATVAEVLGAGSWTRRQLVLERDGTVWAWTNVHDRAAGRTMVQTVVHPDCPDADEVAASCLGWQEDAGREVGRWRGLEETQLDGLLDEGDQDGRRWHAAAGYAHTRTWLNMKRPVSPDEPEPEARGGVSVRRVGVHDLGDGTTMPVAEDLHAVHRVLEESFEDHFNSYRESFPEFAQRLREDPGHRWDHWWLALVEVDGEVVPGGALVCTASGSGSEASSYVEYLGVHRRARGRGVAKTLLATVARDAAERGRGTVALEVDADSPTGADGLYRSVGFETAYVTESWQKDVAVD